MVRPSIMTSSLLATLPLKPRAEIAYWRASIAATCRFGARRRASGSVVAPLRRISSPAMT
jgi:hypothetical protein